MPQLWKKAQWHLPAPEASKEKPKGPQKKKNVPRTIRARAKAKPIGTDLTHKGKGSTNWSLSCGQCLQYGQASYGIHSQRSGKDEQDFSRQVIDEIKFVKSSIDVELGKFDAKLKKITSAISELKINDKMYTEWYELTNVRLDSITNTCDRIQIQCQVQNDEMEDDSILNIKDQLRILKDYILEIINNTNQFATPLAKSKSERQKLKNEIIANVKQIHKNYEPHIPRHSKPFTNENPSVKGSLTPFLRKILYVQKIFPNWKNGQHSMVKENKIIFSSPELFICFKKISTYLMK
ncbi:hypothetical protein O181_051832 [Austropuccinia psidii MF-1]|uniref:Uncharacterized protein n=1 Tax=Austropuccinia psidii MF-1 TaxID=1389203 RepID=A0A9Q3E6F5_9BASI|nr:hypothetical protein [Austropuccinia psidii MF-1]